MSYFHQLMLRCDTEICMVFENKSELALLSAYVRATYGNTDVLVIIQKDTQDEATRRALWENLEALRWSPPAVFWNSDYIFIAGVENLGSGIDEIFSKNPDMHLRLYQNGVCKSRNRF